MFRMAMNHVNCIKLARGLFINNNNIFANKVLNKPTLIQSANISKTPQDHNESDDEFNDRMECFFNRSDIDGWEIRKGLNELAGLDLIPEPRILIAALCAARRVNDYALTTRTLEMAKFKCGPFVKEIYPYLLKQLEPCLTELGIDTPECLGYELPELYQENVFEIH